jgi:hypothetical protein
VRVETYFLAAPLSKSLDGEVRARVLAYAENVEAGLVG